MIHFSKIVFGVCVGVLAALPASAQRGGDLLDRHWQFSFKSSLPSINTSLSSPVVLAPILYDASLPRGAVFCRMENKVFERYNFWFKIHAGGEVLYHSH